MLNTMERAILEMLLAGEDKRLAILRSQLDSATVVDREFGLGFFTKLSVPAHIPRLQAVKWWLIGDVLGEVTGFRYPAGFQLFVVEGTLDLLECYIFDDDWPEDPKLHRLYYVHPAASRRKGLVETKERDLQYALGRHGGPRQ